ncbi:hypothetical protein H310_11264 [Aphanomyces invadans]|uniref:Uncharacterized protein n=1 Tax=Aphanomyces invadans TaxID=157072 RepID=A0A024TN01_9STRA|nr:hypothetical protein H310_11264 [Aphanomyces invadans]ETV95383.1 hypothetical protein H310_11264 [Aphanomyces invadans]|eukprot:XP_008876084.1 hypothetical protein H310_11264 [Aphanomyces invadans]
MKHYHVRNSTSDSLQASASDLSWADASLPRGEILTHHSCDRGSTEMQSIAGSAAHTLFGQHSQWHVRFL